MDGFQLRCRTKLSFFSSCPWLSFLPSLPLFDHLLLADQILLVITISQCYFLLETYVKQIIQKTNNLFCNFYRLNLCNYFIKFFPLNVLHNFAHRLSYLQTRHRDFYQRQGFLAIIKTFLLSLAVTDAVYLTYRPVSLMLTLKGFAPCCHTYC